MVDIHLHFDGSISPACARRLEELGGVDLSLSDEELHERLSVHEGCRDLNEYLTRFDFPLSLLQSESQLAEAAYLLLEELEALGLAYAELRFAPQYQVLEGLTQRQAVEAVLAGLSRSSFDAQVILCCMRAEDNEAENIETIELAAEYLGRGVCAVDLAGAEALFPTRDFADLFVRAERLGVPYTIHAGEAAGPESIREALAMGTRRIGHGVRAVEDPALLAQLAREGICCELCPTSNLNTGVFPSYRDFPLPAFLEAGVPVAICSDNMSVSGTDAMREREIMRETFSLDAATMRELSLNAARAAFLPEDARERLVARICA